MKHKRITQLYNRREIIEDTAGPHVVSAQVIVEHIRTNPDETKAKEILGARHKDILTASGQQRIRKP